MNELDVLLFVMFVIAIPVKWIAVAFKNEVLFALCVGMTFVLSLAVSGSLVASGHAFLGLAFAAVFMFWLFMNLTTVRKILRRK